MRCFDRADEETAPLGVALPYSFVPVYSGGNMNELNNACKEFYNTHLKDTYEEVMESTLNANNLRFIDYVVGQTIACRIQGSVVPAGNSGAASNAAPVGSAAFPQ